MDNIIVRLTKFPNKIKGYTALDDDGNYNVYINCNLSADTQYKAFRHELEHISEKHWDYKVDVDQAESQGHR